MFSTKIKQFRFIAITEGISFLILLLIAMPLKYMYGMPEYTKIVGMAHGILFLTFIYLLLEVHSQYKWSIKYSLFAFVSSLIPFGTFLLERRFKEEIKKES